jgi:hypothetical protein
MSFNVLELHWFHRNYYLIEKLDLKEELNKVLGSEKTHILFTTKNHPQIKEILQKHSESLKKNYDENNIGNSLGNEYLKIQSSELLNQLRNKLTSIVPFSKILDSSDKVDSYDSLWFLPTILLRPEFYDNIESIIRKNIYEPSISLYVKYLVLLIRKNSNNKDNLKSHLVNIYNEFKEKYILIGSSAASEDTFNLWSNI